MLRLWLDFFDYLNAQKFFDSVIRKATILPGFAYNQCLYVRNSFREVLRDRLQAMAHFAQHICKPWMRVSMPVQEADSACQLLIGYSPDASAKEEHMPNKLDKTFLGEFLLSHINNLSSRSFLINLSSASKAPSAASFNCAMASSTLKTVSSLSGST